MSISIWIWLFILLGIVLFILGFIFSCKGIDEDVDKWYN